MQYSCFDPDAEVEITTGRLPHWEQAGCYHFITFYTADSLPTVVRATWRDEQNRWLISRGINPRHPEWQSRFAALPVADRRIFSSRFAGALQKLLDEGHGPCHLRRPELRSLVTEALMSFDGKRYGIEAFVVMPNHVHVLVGLHERGTLIRQARSWKRYSARQINARLGRRGAFWQAESWDRLVRSPESFERIRRYIAFNPRQAGLGPQEYTLYMRSSQEPG